MEIPCVKPLPAPKLTPETQKLKLKPPAHLSIDSKRLWKSICEDFEIDDPPQAKPRSERPAIAAIGDHLFLGMRRRSSSRKFSRKVTWTGPLSGPEASGIGNTAKRLPSGASARFEVPGKKICLSVQRRGLPGTNGSLIPEPAVIVVTASEGLVAQAGKGNCTSSGIGISG